MSRMQNINHIGSKGISFLLLLLYAFHDASILMACQTRHFQSENGFNNIQTGMSCSVHVQQYSCESECVLLTILRFSISC